MTSLLAMISPRRVAGRTSPKPSVAGDSGSERDSRSQAEDQGVGNSPRRGCGRRQRNMTAGMEDQLQIRLQSPPWRNAGLVGDFERGLVITYRAGSAREQDLVPVQAAGIANPPKDCANAQHVELAVREEALEGEAGIHLEAEQIAIGRGIAEAEEGGQTLGRRIGAAPHHLVHHQIGPEIAAMPGGHAIARWVGEREPRAIPALIGEFSRVIPGTDFDVAQVERRNGLLVERVSKFDNWHEATLADQKVGAA